MEGRGERVSIIKKREREEMQRSGKAGLPKMSEFKFSQKKQPSPENAKRVRLLESRAVYSDQKQLLVRWLIFTA